MPVHRITASFSFMESYGASLFTATQYRRLQLIVETRPGWSLDVYGRGRHRTLALRAADGAVLAKAHFSIQTADEAAERVAKALTLDGELPIGMRAPQ